MLRKIVYFFLFLFPIMNFGQSTIESKKDTIIDYKEGKKYYVLDLVGIKQTIYFDNANYDNGQPIVILIRNNTTDTVWVSHSKGLVSGKHALDELSTRYLRPFECYSLSLKLPEFKYTPGIMMPINDFITLYYSANFQENQFHFALKGNVQLGVQPKFDFEEQPDVIIASTPLPQSILDRQRGMGAEQKSENVGINGQNNSTPDPPFEFRKELWIYPFTTDSILPTNLTLKYYINDSSNYAKKRLDSMNRVFFKIPMELGDSLYCVLSSPEYGFVSKKTIVREQVNEVTISFEVGAKLNEPHYYNGVGNRIAIKSSFIGCYYIPRDYKISDFSQKRLDSLNALIKSFNAILKYGMDGGFIIKCKPEFAIQIKKKLGNLDFYQIIDENVWITDLYKLDFSLPLSQENISALLNKYGITDIYIEPSPDYSNNLDKNAIRHITFRMENLPGNIKNCKIISDLLTNMEVLRVTQSPIKFFGHADD